MNTVIEPPELDESEPSGQIKCAYCDCEVDFDDSRYLEGAGDVCQGCFCEAVHTCQLCGNDEVLDHDVSNYIVVKAELAETDDILPGIYKITSRPFLSIPLVGSGNIWGNDVLFVACLPKPDWHYEISGHICRKCAWPYSQIYGRVYGQIRHRRGFRRRLAATREPWYNAQRRHVKASFERNPLRLRDLETDYPEDLETLQRKWGLSKLRTYHEWLLLEHGDVRIYKTHRTDRHGDGWLLLKPEPKYRALAYGSGYNVRKEEGMVLFCASSLPTFPTRPDDDKYHWSDDWKRRHSVPAIKRAIELGLIRQHGTFDAAGNPKHYG